MERRYDACQRIAQEAQENRGLTRSIACAVLAARKWGNSEEEEEGKESMRGGSLSFAAISIVGASTPGEHGTPFVYRTDKKKYQKRMRGRKDDADSSCTDGQEKSASTRIKIQRNCCRRVCRIDARGSPCRHTGIRTHKRRPPLPRGGHRHLQSPPSPDHLQARSQRGARAYSTHGKCNFRRVCSHEGQGRRK